MHAWGDGVKNSRLIIIYTAAILEDLFLKILALEY
jgi:hypothetical protein